MLCGGKKHSENELVHLHNKGNQQQQQIAIVFKADNCTDDNKKAPFFSALQETSLVEMRKKGGKWPHLLSWKLATSENVFGARGWPVNGVNANKHNEGRGWANVPISSIRQSTTGSRLLKPPPPSLPTSYSPCQKSFFWEVGFEGFLGPVHLLVFSSNIFIQIWTEFQFFEPFEMWESPMFLYSPK